MKFSPEEITIALRAAKAEPDIIDQTIRKLLETAEETKEEKTPRQKKQIVGILLKQAEALPEAGCERQIFCVQIDMDADHNQIVPNIISAVAESNAALKKKKALPIKTLTDAFLLLKPKFLKEKGAKILTKEPIIIVEAEDEIKGAT